MKIAIMTGGLGSEKKISLKSADYIRNKIDFAEVEMFLYPEHFNYFLERSSEFDLIIPVIHGVGGEDGELQRLLDEKNIKYLFSDVETHKTCFNKSIAKKKVEKLGFHVPRSFSFIDLSHEDLPIIAKPRENGSSVGIYLIKTIKDLENLKEREGYLYEEYITGREFSVGIVDFEDKVLKLPIMEIRKDNEIFDFTDKYSDLSEEIEVFPDDIPYELDVLLKEVAFQIHKEFRLKHMSRSDFIVSDGGNIYFLEVNSIPGCTAESFIPKMVSKYGLDFSTLLKIWCDDVLKKS